MILYQRILIFSTLPTRAAAVCGGKFTNISKFRAGVEIEKYRLVWYTVKDIQAAQAPRKVEESPWI